MEAAQIGNQERNSTAIKNSDTREIYSVADMKIEAKSTNSDAAKKEALNAGQRRALKILLTRLGFDPKNSKFIGNSAIGEMISGMRLRDELITKNSYSSQVTFQFDPDFVNYTLNDLKLKKGQLGQEVILYIPIYDDGSGELSIMDSDNPWYSTVYDRFFEDEDARENLFIIDNYSLSNSGLISEEKIRAKKYDSFSTLLRKYASNVVVISLAKYNEKMDRMEITLIEIDAENIKSSVLNYVNRDSLPVDELISEASLKTYDFVLNLHSKKSSRQDSATNSKDNSNKTSGVSTLADGYIDVLIPIRNLRDYVYLKNLVKNLTFIKNYETIEMTTKVAKVKLWLNCNEAQLIDLFRRKNIILDNRSDQYFLYYAED